MPVYHEKTEKTARLEGASSKPKNEATSSRESSKHRTKQREISIERKPIISQEKPPVRRSQKIDPNKEKKGITKTSSSVKEKPNITKQRTSTGSTTTTAVRTDVKPKVMRQETLIKAVKEKKAEISKRTQLKVNPKTTENSKMVRETIKTKQQVQPEKLLNKSVKISSREKFKKTPVENVNTEVRRNHDRSRTRTLSPSEVKIRPAEVKSERVASAQKTAKEVKPRGIEKEDKKQDEKVINSHDIQNDREKAGYSERGKVVDEYNDEEGEDDTDDEDDNDSTGDQNTDYEDDFEDYESDFEDESDTEEAEEKEPAPDESQPEVSNILGSAGTSSRRMMKLTSAEERERERKLDSGSYHISAAPRKREIEEIKMAMENENRQQRKQSLLEDTDEGYLEGVEKRKPQNVFEPKPEILDFAKAGKRSKEQENTVKAKRRAEELSRMITLDSITYTLMDIPAIPYDVFMTTYGRSDTSQVHIQTNEDDCEEEVQTEEIDISTKWTQAPPRFTPPKNRADGKPYVFSKEERLGVGGIEESKQGETEPFLSVSQLHLLKFMNTSAQRVLIWLESRNQQNPTTEAQKASELTCCDSMMALNTSESSPTKERSAVKITATSNHHLVLSVELTPDSESIIKLWTLLTPSKPLKVLICRQEVTCANFGPGRGDLVFAGARDGSVNLWDLRENNEQFSSSDSKPLGRSPTYSTAEILKNQGHLSPVVAIITLKKDAEEENSEFRPIQICSLDEGGEVVVWSVVQQSAGNRSIANADLGLAPWGRVLLVRSSSFKANDLSVRTLDDDTILTGRFYTVTSRGSSGRELLIASGSGQVLHCSIDGVALKPKFYVPSKNARPSAVTTIAVYPPDERYFLAGCSDGTIRLHCKDQERALINLHWNLGDDSSFSSVKCLQWFPNKPCMFFVLDSSSRVHIWDLATSDIYPQFTLPKSSKNPFSCGAVLRPRNLSLTGSMVFGRANGLLEVHRIKCESEGNQKEQWKKESKIFHRFVKIL